MHLKPTHIHLKKLLTNDWKTKLLCLACAVVVWLMVHSLIEGDSTGWDIHDIRISLPE